MRCRSCSHENRDAAAFCEQCGESLAARCAQCDTLLRPGAQFCDGCGEPVARPLPEEPAAAGARRQVTVMFCDLVDSTPLSERLDPEDLRDVVHDYHELCRREIEGMGGHLEQYLGDGILAYFGFPVAREQDTRAAVQAGLAIVERIRSNSPSASVPIQVRVGIHTGLVVSGQMQYGEQRAQLTVGSTMNIAARLQGFAQPNTVVISETTRTLVTGFFRCRDIGRHPMKGISDPISVFEVEAETGVGGRIEAGLGAGIATLVGRQQERAQLLEAWQKTRAGAAQTVHVIGDAGIGKSRLLFELKKSLAGESYQYLEVRAAPQREASALFPIIDLLERLWGLRRLDTPEARLERLREALASHASIPDVAPLLASLLSIKGADSESEKRLAPHQRRQRTLDALVEVLTSSENHEPVLLAVEDLHWLDPSTIELLSLLIERSAGRAVMLLLLFRPVFEPPWAGRAEITELRLERFTEEEAAALVRSVAGDRELPDEIVQELHDKSDGVPFYLEELTKVARESDAIAIPATLQELLMARLDRLAPVRSVIQLASTIGRAFSPALIRAAASVDDTTLDAELVQLVDAELLYEAGTSERPTYVFKHALIQEATYESMLRGQRSANHRRIAEAMATQFPEVFETQPELLGRHWEGAGSIPEAVTCYHRAGSRAIERSANAEASSQLQRALGLIDQPSFDGDPSQELEVCIDLGVAQLATQGFTSPEVEQTYARADKLCDQVGETSRRRYDVLSGLHLFRQARGELAAAHALSDRRSALAKQLGDDSLMMLVHEARGTLAFWRGEFAEALASVERALALYQPDQARALALVYGTHTKPVCLTYAAQALWFLGRPDLARQRAEEAVRSAREIGHANSLALALAFASSYHNIAGDQEQSRAYAEETIAFAHEQQLDYWIGMGTIYLGYATAALGEGETGIAQMIEGIGRHTRFGSRLGSAFCMALLGEAHLFAGRPQDGSALLEQAIPTLGDYEDRFFDAELLRIRGVLLLAAPEGNDTQGERLLQDAVAMAKQQATKSMELRTTTSLCRHLAASGNREDALEQLSAAYGVFDEGFNTGDLRSARELLAQLR